MTILYHEKQESALCGQHCLNNLLQGPYYNAGTLADLALELDRQERALMMSEGMTAEAKAFLNEESGNVDAQGNFSIQVLSESLKRSFALELTDVRHEDVRPLMRDPSKAEGFVINRHAHWLCLRKLDGQWWRINSTEEAPERIADQHISRDLAQAAGDDWSVFVVQGGKLPAQVPRHEGEPSNWTDTTKAMGFGTVLGGGGGGGAQAKPSVVAFSGSGNTLGGSSAPAAPAGAAGSEDQQLAQALAQSKDEALKLRLEQRLPAEPETTVGAARVLVKLPDGTRSSRRFPKDSPLQSLVDFTCIQLAQHGAASGARSWKLVCTQPALSLEFSLEAWSDAAHMEATFESAQLTPSAMFEARPVQ